MHLIPTKTKNSKMNCQTTKIEVELDEEELKILDDYIDDLVTVNGLIKKSRSEGITTIIFNYDFLDKLFEIFNTNTINGEEYDEKLHEQIKHYQGDIENYHGYINNLHNDIRQYQDHIGKLNEEIRQYKIEFGKYTKENKDYKIGYDAREARVKRDEDIINKLENEVKKLKEENSKLKKENKSPKVANNKKPIEMKKENSKLKKESDSPKAANNKPIEVAVPVN